jgi:hypothetical protein
MLLIELFFLGVIAASPSDSVRTLDKLTVTDKKVIDRSVVSIKSEEQMTGMVEDIDKLLIHKKGIDRVSEAGSLFLIHGNGIYDNLFIVGDIPVFPPSHYAGSTFADRSGISMASIDELQYYINNTPGKFADFPGGVIKLTPRALRTAAAAASGRPELLLNIGSNAAEFFLSSQTDIPSCGSIIPVLLRFINIPRRLILANQIPTSTSPSTARQGCATTSRSMNILFIHPKASPKALSMRIQPANGESALCHWKIQTR